MEVILCQDVERLGKTGDVIKVKGGFARNYLFPQKIATLATPTNLRAIEQQKSKKILQEEKVRKEAEELAKRVSAVSYSIAVEVNDLEKLYGSVAESDIAHALEIEGFHVDKKAVQIEKPITELGIYEAGVRLHPQVTAKIRLWVTKK